MLPEKAAFSKKRKSRFDVPQRKSQEVVNSTAFVPKKLEMDKEQDRNPSKKHLEKFPELGPKKPNRKQKDRGSREFSEPNRKGISAGLQGMMKTWKKKAEK